MDAGILSPGDLAGDHQPPKKLRAAVPPMTITVELPPEIEERFRAQAAARGMSIAALIQEFLERSSPSIARPTLSSEGINRVFDEAADLVPGDARPLTDEAMSRESIYAREDEW